MGHVIITGGSSGIGAAFARAYAGMGHSVSILARGEDRLSETAADIEGRHAKGKARIHYSVADVTDAGQLDQAIEACEAALGPCTLLVACAGVVAPHAFITQSKAAFDAQIAVNLVGVANSVRAVLAKMIERGTGQILIVSSGAALIGIPGYTAYCASKSALAGFAEALHMEAKPADVSVHVCFPPDTDTPQLAQELPLRSRQAEALIGKAGIWKPDDLARHVITAMNRGTFAIYPGASLKVLGHLGSLIKPVLRRWQRA